MDLGALYNEAKSVIDSVNPIKWASDQFNLGQARDEARSIRAGDIERDEKWLERNSVSGRIAEGMSRGLSLTAAAGLQPSSVTAATVGQDTGYLNSAGGQNFLTAEERRQLRLNTEILQQQKEGLELDNLRKSQDILDHENRKIGQPVAGDNIMPGGGQVVRGGLVVDEPLKRTASLPGRGSQEAGVISDFGYTLTHNGNLAIRPGTEQKQSMEDDLISELAWHLRNRAAPPPYPKEHDPGPGKYWKWIPLLGEWYREKIGKEDYHFWPSEGHEYEKYFRKRGGK